jgi:ligand-binding sensor domain-containing protein
MNRAKVIISFCAIIWSLTTNAAGDTWIGYLGGRTINSIAFDAEKGWAWFATAANGAFRFDGKDFTSYNVITTNGGVASDSLKYVLFDGEELWFGTSNSGVSRFNPETNEWRTYTQRDGLASNKVRSIAAGIMGNIWIGTEGGGVSCFDRETNWITYNTSNGLSSNSVTAIAIDRTNKKWFGTRDRGLSVLDADNRWCYFLGDTTILSIYIEAAKGSENIWLGTAKGGIVYKMVSQSAKCDELASIRTYPLKEAAVVLSVWVDEDGNKWFGTNRGAARLDSLEKHIRFFNDETNLNLRGINAIVGDNDGNIWFGATGDQGTIKYSANWVTFTLKDGLPSNTVHALVQDGKGKIWAGTQGGLATLNGMAWESHIFDLKGCFTRNQITAIEFDQVGGMWLGTKSCGAIYVSPDDASLGNPVFYDTLAPNAVNDISTFSGEVWFATQGGLSLFRPDSNRWVTFTVDSGLVNNFTKAVAIDKNGTIWCGTVDGVSRYDRQSWKNFTTKDGLAGNHINDIVIDSLSGKIWFATEGQGVSIFNSQNGQWETVTTINGLADNVVNAIALEPNSAGVWFGTANGASFLDSLGNWHTFRTQHGLGENFVTSLLRDRRGRIWFGSNFNGVTRYKRKTNRPNIQLLNRFDVTTSSEVSYSFVGSDLGTTTHLLRYAYKLDNRNYSPWTFDTFARVVNLSNGLHTFYVKTIDTDGNESDEVKDTFYKIALERGLSTSFTYKARYRGLDSVKIALFWPPNQFVRDPQIRIDTVASASVDTLILFAFDLSSQDKNLIFLQKPITLTFSFQPKDFTQGKTLGIYQEGPKIVKLGGTSKNDGEISTVIQEFGRYTVRREYPLGFTAPLKDSVKVNAQPRIFSPKGGGHSEQTTISFKLDKSEHVRIHVYNLAGRLIDTICDETLNAGINAVTWDGKDQHHRFCPSGLYIMVIESNGFQSPPKPVKVMVLNE